MVKLGIDIESIAVLRRTGANQDADPAKAVVFVELGGGDAVICPLVEDFSLITERDVKLIKSLGATRVHIQTPIGERTLTAALSAAPNRITLAPGMGESGNGLNVVGMAEPIAEAVKSIRSHRIEVGLKIEPLVHHVKAAAKCEAEFVELNISALTACKDPVERAEMVENFHDAMAAGQKLGIGVAVSGGIDYSNAAEIAGLPGIMEVNVGHPVISRGLWIGLEQAVRDMAGLVKT
jgi:pyridoxine 5-phosphate synthase